MNGQASNAEAISSGEAAMPQPGLRTEETMSRRRMLILGLGAAWAVPTIATLRPSPALAVSPPPNGNGNGTNGTNGPPPEPPEPPDPPERPEPPEPPEEDVRDEVVEDDDPPVEVEDDEVAVADDEGTPDPEPRVSAPPEDETVVMAATDQPLARTGLDLGWLAAAGGAAFAGGAAALRASRRSAADEGDPAGGMPPEALD